MLTLRTSSPFALVDRLDQQVSRQLSREFSQQFSQQPHSAERRPAAEVQETPEAYAVVLELPGVDKGAIEVKATERTLLISAERRNPRQRTGPTHHGEPGRETPTPTTNSRGALLSEFRYGTCSRGFRFAQPIARDQLQAVYRDGLLTVTVPKANTLSTVTVKVEG